MPAKGHKRDAGSHGRCGDFGGVTSAGKPCGRVSVGGLCSWHGGDGPELLDRQVHDRIVGALKAGVHFSIAGKANGVPERTLRDWVARGDKDPDGPYGEFARDVEQARAVAEASAVAIVRRAGSGYEWARIERRAVDGKDIEEKVTEGTDSDWRAAAWWLERAHPGRWKQNVGSMITGADGGPVKITEVQHHYHDKDEEEDDD